MIRLIKIIWILFFCSVVGHAQTYKVSLKKDAAPLAIGIGLTSLGLILDPTADGPSLQDISLLNQSDLNFLDRGVIGNNSSTARSVSDVILYSSISLPFITYFSKKCRTDAGAIAIMALETALINNGISNIIKSTSKRYRPYNYNPMVGLDTKLSRKSRRSFVSGHASNTASFAFLTARVITDLHPDMKHKYLVWTTAATIPAVIGILRIQAGKHFPTDVIGGYIIGAAVGYFIPSMHLIKDNNLNISTNGISGLNVSLKF